MPSNAQLAFQPSEVSPKVLTAHDLYFELSEDHVSPDAISRAADFLHEQLQ